MLGSLARFHMLHAFTPPYCNAILHEHDNEYVKELLDYLRVGWASLQNLEEAARTNARARDIVKSFVFPSQCWAREVMIQLMQQDFNSVDAATAEDAKLFAESLGSSLVNELTGNAWRDSARHDKAKKLDPQAAWHRSYAKDPLIQIGRRLLPRTQAARNSVATKGAFPKENFRATTEGCSLTREVLERIHVHSPTWPTPSPYNFKEAALVWMNLVESGGALRNMQKSGLRLLAPAGTLLLSLDGRLECLVIKLSDNGLGVLGVTVKKDRGCVVATVSWDLGFRFTAIQDHTQFRASNTMLLGPSAMKGGESHICSLVLGVVDKSIP